MKIFAKTKVALI